MADEHAIPAVEEEKKHGDKLADIVSSHDDSSKAEEHNSAIPEPENGGHAQSVAAHLKGNEHLHGNAVKGAHFYEPMTAGSVQKQPPQQISRSGKQHRGQ